MDTDLRDLEEDMKDVLNTLLLVHNDMYKEDIKPALVKSTMGIAINQFMAIICVLDDMASDAD